MCACSPFLGLAQMQQTQNLRQKHPSGCRWGMTIIWNFCGSSLQSSDGNAHASNSPKGIHIGIPESHRNSYRSFHGDSRNQPFAKPVMRGPEIWCDLGGRCDLQGCTICTPSAISNAKRDVQSAHHCSCTESAGPLWATRLRRLSL